MSIAQYCFPQKTFFGSGCVQKLAEELPKDGKLLIVAGKRASESESAQKILDRLAPRTAALYQKVPAEPPLDCVDEIIALGREKNVQAVAAIGGGSVMDAAKAAAALIPLDGSVSDYFRGKRTLLRRGTDHRRNRSGSDIQCGPDRSGNENQEIAPSPGHDGGSCADRSGTDALHPAGSDSGKRTGRLRSGI